MNLMTPLAHRAIRSHIAQDAHAMAALLDCFASTDNESSSDQIPADS
jgi:hypothetical protein